MRYYNDPGLAPEVNHSFGHYLFIYYLFCHLFDLFSNLFDKKRKRRYSKLKAGRIQKLRGPHRDKTQY